MSEEKLVIGVYDRNATNEIAYFTIDEHNLTITFSTDGGIGDAIGRTLETYWVYDDPKLIEGIANNWQYRNEYKGKDYKGKMVGVRHPDFVEKEGLKWYELGARMSRDHYIYTLIALKLWEKRNGREHPKLKEIVDATPFGIRNMARWTLGLILWSKAIRGNKTALLLSLCLDWFVINAFYIPIRKLGYKLTGWGEEMDQDEWELIQHDPTQTNEQYQPKWFKQADSIVYPSYAISFSAKQLYVTPDTFPKLKKAVQKSMLKMVGKTNYVQQMLLGKKDIPRDKVEAYKTMRGGRWSGYLSNRNDRDMKVQPEGRYTVNVKDVDMVRFLYNETQLN